MLVPPTLTRQPSVGQSRIARDRSAKRSTSVLVSHRHRLIFIKTRKTSIEIALSTVCGLEDLVTRLLPDLDGSKLDWQCRKGANHEGGSGLFPLW